MFHFKTLVVFELCPRQHQPLKQKTWTNGSRKWHLYAFHLGGIITCIIFKVQCFTFKMPYFFSRHPMNNKESPCIVWAAACHLVHGASLQTYVCMAGHWTWNPCMCRLQFQGRPYTRWPQHGHHWLTPCKHNAFSENLKCFVYIYIVCVL